MVCAVVPGCERGLTRATHVVDRQGRRPLTSPPSRAPTHDVLLDGRIRLIQAAVDDVARPGERVSVSLTFLVEKSCEGLAPKLFVHAAAPGAEVNQAQVDLVPVGGKVPVASWQRGDLVVDDVELALPATLAVDSLVVRVGLFEGKRRWTAEPAAAHDGQDRVEIGRVRVEGTPPTDVKTTVLQRRGPVTVDGILDEPDWQRASRLGPFVAWDGRSPIERKTWARLLWDDENLWVAFEGEDPDVFTPYKNHDDPLYDSEAIEVFLDADGDADEYVELQAAPANDLHFDAAFRGGRRKNMDRAWGAPYITKTVTTTTGFVSEWKIPVRTLKDVPAGEPRAGTSWKANLFRLERVRRENRTTRTEASAWSSPLSGDFHNLARFGTLSFVDDGS